MSHRRRRHRGKAKRKHNPSVVAMFARARSLMAQRRNLEAFHEDKRLKRSGLSARKETTATIIAAINP